MPVLAVTFNDLAQAVVIGLITGAVYSLVALALVLIYRSSGVFNFAQGEFGTVAIYVTWFMVESLDIPYGIGFIGGLAAAVGVGLLSERLVIRPLFDAPRVTLLVATAGVSLLAIGIEFWRTAENPLKFFPAISQEPSRLSIIGVQISDQRLLTLLALVAVAFALTAFFRSPYGLAVLAASQEPVASELVGVSVTRISALTWGIAAFLGGLAGLLFFGGSSFAPGAFTSQALIPGFTAAVIGGLTSLPGAVLGGLIIGLLASLGQLSTFSAIPGASSVSVFVVLLGVLLVKPEGILGGRAA